MGAKSRSPTKSTAARKRAGRSEEHTSELQSRLHLVCRLLLEKKKKNICKVYTAYPAIVLVRGVRPLPPSVPHNSHARPSVGCVEYRTIHSASRGASACTRPS